VGACIHLWVDLITHRVHVEESYLHIYVEVLGQYVRPREIYMIITQLVLAIITWIVYKINYSHK